jgi:transcriptional regulator GlxA family with amidase domain
VFGRLAAELHERVHEVSTWERRIAGIDLVLSRALRPAPDVRPEVAWAWREIMRTGGAVRVADLAAEVGLSTRHLDTTMRRETGLSPKLAARVVRFDRATRLLMSGPGRLADVAVECGYFDQAHLARDFRELAGCSPSRWLAEEFRFVQVDEDSASAE